MTVDKNIYTNRGVALEALTPRQREYYIARHFNRWSYGLIAEVYGVTRQAVQQSVSRATENLRAAGITPPADKQDAGTVQKCNAPTRRVVNLGWIDEIEG